MVWFIGLAIVVGIGHITTKGILEVEGMQVCVCVCEKDYP